jgi:hypothetical protein
VDLKFTITGESGTKYDTSFTAKDMVGGTNITMKTIRKSDGTVAAAKEKLLSGTYNWIWDAAADLPKDFKCERMTVTGNAVECDPLYMVIDLSSGVITYLDAVPSKGWSNTYKTTHMVLRRVSASGSEGEFYIGVFEVTQAQWEKLGFSNPSRYKSSLYPVENITGWSARSYIKKLRTLTNVEYFCFPSENQWHIAASYGPGGFYSYYIDGVYSGAREYLVGSYEANNIGIYDLKGNVSEWIRYKDAYGTLGSYYDASLAQASAWNTVESHMGPSASFIELGMRMAYSVSDYKSANGSGGFD